MCVENRKDQERELHFHHHMEGSSSLENTRSRAEKNDCPAPGRGVSYKSETRHQS